MNAKVEGKFNVSSWSNRVTIIIPSKQMKALKRGKMAQVMKDKRWYELRPAQTQPVYDHKGIELTKAQLRAILRRM